MTTSIVSFITLIIANSGQIRYDFDNTTQPKDSIALVVVGNIRRVEYSISARELIDISFSNNVLPSSDACGEQRGKSLAFDADCNYPNGTIIRIKNDNLTPVRISGYITLFSALNHQWIIWLVVALSIAVALVFAALIATSLLYYYRFHPCEKIHKSESRVSLADL
ncbi:MAG: hypothetical protein M0R33_18810 [Methylomonas sp.]|jgi:hypothetical protein|uniref:hypothetical protein n=1 Tax=Methylomonas sp. TaxID=418 RepID=UPI0025D85F14|nr:hypothetical protein [Methylomonas sp.]MCK9608496.1 hypothetical protein [Methylomonas sp.]